MDFLRLLFSVRGILIGVYVLIGVFVNTASPHLPVVPNSIESIHSWIQWFISVFFWPFSLWHPVFTSGKWTP